jgi:topoisomerase-4 subunit B
MLNNWAIENEVIKPNQSIDGSDIREGLTAIISVKIPEDISSNTKARPKASLARPKPDRSSATFSIPFHLLSQRAQSFRFRLLHKCDASREAREAARKAKEAARGNQSQEKRFDDQRQTRGRPIEGLRPE